LSILDGFFGTQTRKRMFFYCLMKTKKAFFKAQKPFKYMLKEGNTILVHNNTIWYLLVHLGRVNPLGLVKNDA